MPLAFAVFDEKYKLIDHNFLFSEAMAISGITAINNDFANWVRKLIKNPIIAKGSFSILSGEKVNFICIPQLRLNISDEPSTIEHIRFSMERVKHSIEQSAIGNYEEKYELSAPLDKSKPAKCVVIHCKETLIAEILAIYMRRFGYTPLIVQADESIKGVLRLPWKVDVAITCDDLVHAFRKNLPATIVITEFGRYAETQADFPDYYIIEKPPRMDMLKKIVTQIEKKRKK